MAANAMLRIMVVVRHDHGVVVDGGWWMVDGGRWTVDGGWWMVDGGWWMVGCSTDLHVMVAIAAIVLGQQEVVVDLGQPV